MISDSQGPTVRPAEVKPHMQRIRQKPSKFPSTFSKVSLRRKGGFDGKSSEQINTAKRAREGESLIPAQREFDTGLYHQSSIRQWPEQLRCCGNTEPQCPIGQCRSLDCQQHGLSLKPVSLQSIEDHRPRFKNVKRETKNKHKESRYISTLSPFK